MVESSVHNVLCGTGLSAVSRVRLTPALRLAPWLAPWLLLEVAKSQHLFGRWPLC